MAAMALYSEAILLVSFILSETATPTFKPATGSISIRLIDWGP